MELSRWFIIAEKITEKQLSAAVIAALRVFFVMCLLGTIAFIYYNSLQIARQSTVASDEVLGLANRLSATLGLSLAFSEGVIRKLAHVAEYMLLGFWLMLTLRVYKTQVVSFLSWPLFLGLFVAVTDEFLQGFVAGRSSEVKDVLIDFGGLVGGLLAGLIAIWLAAAIWRASHKKDK